MYNDLNESLRDIKWYPNIYRKDYPGTSFVQTAASSGLYLSAFSLGAFLGPILGGIVYDTMGFRSMAYIALALQLCLVS